MAKHILGVVRPLAASVVIDLAFVIEGQHESELPERLLAAVRLHRINLGDERLQTPDESIAAPCGAEQGSD